MKNFVEVLLFSIIDNQLKILLVDYPNYIGLPSGEVQKDENLDESVLKVLNEYLECDLNIYFRQLYTLGKANRVREQRVISTSYISLVPYQSIIKTKRGTWCSISKSVVSYNSTSRESLVTIKEGQIDTRYRVIDLVVDSYISKRSELVEGSTHPLQGDYIKMVNMALDKLQHGIASSGLLFSLLPETFTLKETQNAYEAVKGKKVDTPNFRRDISKMLIPTGVMKKTNRKEAMTYRFDPLFQYLREDL